MRHASFLVAFAIGVGACRQTPMASLAECEHLRDRYIDLQLSSLRAARLMTSEDRANLRGRLAIEDLSSPLAAKLDARCMSSVTQGGYACAVRAETLDTWLHCVQ